MHANYSYDGNNPTHPHSKNNETPPHLVQDKTFLIIENYLNLRRSSSFRVKNMQYTRIQTNKLRNAIEQQQNRC